MVRLTFIAASLALVLAGLGATPAGAQQQSDGIQNSRRDYSIFVPGSANTRIAAVSALNPIVGPETAPVASLSARSAYWSPLSNSPNYHEGRVMLTAHAQEVVEQATSQPEIILKFRPRVGFRHVVVCKIARATGVDLEVTQGANIISGFNWQTEPTALLLLAPVTRPDDVELHFRFPPGTQRGAWISLFGCEISSINI